MTHIGVSKLNHQMNKKNAMLFVLKKRNCSEIWQVRYFADWQIKYRSYLTNIKRIRKSLLYMKFVGMQCHVSQITHDEVYRRTRSRHYESMVKIR